MTPITRILAERLAAAQAERQRAWEEWLGTVRAWAENTASNRAFWAADAVFEAADRRVDRAQVALWWARDVAHHQLRGTPGWEHLTGWPVDGAADV